MRDIKMPDGQTSKGSYDFVRGRLRVLKLSFQEKFKNKEIEAAYQGLYSLLRLK